MTAVMRGILAVILWSRWIEVFAHGNWNGERNRSGLSLGYSTSLELWIDLRFWFPVYTTFDGQLRLITCVFAALSVVTSVRGSI